MKPPQHTLLPALVALLLLANASLNAQDDALLVINGGQLFDADSGTVRPLGQLWISDGVVLSEKPADTARPEGAVSIDADGMTLLPGLFDLHCHIALPGGPMTRRLPVTPSQNLASHAYFGITHAVDLHADESMIFELREDSLHDPNMARLYTSGAAFTAPRGHPTQFGTPANTVTTADELQQRLEQLLLKRPDVIKGVQEHGSWGGLPEMPSLSTQLLQALGKRARAAGIPFFCHVWSRAEALAATRAGADALAHGVFTDDVDDELLTAMQESGTAYISTLSVVVGSRRVTNGESPFARSAVRAGLHPALYDAINDPSVTGDPLASFSARLDASFESRPMANLKRVFDAGIPVGLGTDSGNPLTPHGPSAIHELELYVEAGLTPAEALQCATVRSAHILGVADRFGSLAPGKVADMVLVRGDPSTDISLMWNVERVFKAGVPVDREATRAENRRRSAGPRQSHVGVDLPAVIDGFEDGDSTSDWGAGWVAFADSVAGGASGGSLHASSEDGGTLRLAGKIEKGYAWGAWSGMAIDWSANKTHLADATGYTGIRVRLRGSERPYTVTVQREAVKDFNVFAAPLQVLAEWTEVDIPFSSLRQIGFGQPVAWSAHDLTGLNIDARNSPRGESLFGEFDLELDWVRLYR